jgi:hypothetical protein
MKGTAGKKGSWQEAGVMQMSGWQKEGALQVTHHMATDEADPQVM